MPFQPLILWGHYQGPNPCKVLIILEDLNIPYDFKPVDFKGVKQEPFLSLNPNGRMPALEDPNTGISVFESGAIIDYVLEKYDKESKLTPQDEKSKWTARAWRDLQMSGQGPYFGQAVWFSKYHPEKVPSAVERYTKEVQRIVSVFELQLSKEKTEYVAGDQASYADLMFAPWFWYLDDLFPKAVDYRKEYPLFAAWWQRISDRPSVAKVLDQRTKESKAHHS